MALSELRSSLCQQWGRGKRWEPSLLKMGAHSQLEFIWIVLALVCFFYLLKDLAESFESLFLLLTMCLSFSMEGRDMFKARAPGVKCLVGGQRNLKL